MKNVAVYTGTRNLYPMMEPAVKSLLYHSDVDEVWLLIEDYEYPAWLPDIVKIRNVSDQRYFRVDGPNMSNKFTYMAMMRAALAKEFDYKRVLALDVDTIVVDDISGLWGLPLGNEFYFAAAMEPCLSHKLGRMYTNVGVCLYNLEKMRDGMCDRAIDELNTNRYTYLDQDVVNLLCDGNIFPLLSDYNVSRFTQESEHPRIIHYAGYSGWLDMPEYKKYAALGWDEVLGHRREVYGRGL